MNTKVENAPSKQADQATCCHYWIIGHPKHGVSKAVCKFCKARKEFRSSFADSRWMGEMPSDFYEPLDLHYYTDDADKDGY